MPDNSSPLPNWGRIADEMENAQRPIMKSELQNGLVLNRVRHPDVMHMAPHFAFAHLPPHLQNVSRQFARLAQFLVDSQSDGPELVVALRKLWESKNSAVLHAGFIQDAEKTKILKHANEFLKKHGEIQPSNSNQFLEFKDVQGYLEWNPGDVMLDDDTMIKEWIAANKPSGRRP
jgi:hypothetical protein